MTACAAQTSKLSAGAELAATSCRRIAQAGLDHLMIVLPAALECEQ